MKSDKRQTMVLIGVSLLVIAAVMLAVALSQPKVYVSSEQTVQTTALRSGKVSENEKAQIDFPININTATVEELMEVEGLGEARAYDIIEYREVIGEYTDVAQIMDIKGFGESVYNQVAPYLTV